MKRLKRFLKWSVGLATILILAVIVLYFYSIHRRTEFHVTPDLISRAEQLRAESDSLPKLFYVLFDISSPNGTTNSPNLRLIKMILGSENEGCSCRELARLFVSHQNVGALGYGLNYNAIGTFLHDKYNGKICLDMLMNRYDFVNGQVGVENAALFYFNKSIDKLSTLEIATLVVMTENPALYNPIRRPELVEEEAKKLMEKYKKD